MTATAGGGGGSDLDNPLPIVHIVDTTSSQGTGAVSQGIGKTGANGAVTGAKRIGEAADVAAITYVNS